MSNAVHGYGSKLKRNGNEIAELTAINGLEISADTIDVTNHQSPDAYREFIAGLIDPGEVSIEGNLIPSDADGQIGLLADMNARIVQSFEMDFPAVVGTSWSFNAIVTGFTTSAPIDDKIPFSATLKVTGKPTLNITASGGLTALTGVDSAAGALTFVPSFANDTYLYTVDVGSAITYVKFTPTASGHTIAINGSTVASGSESGELALGSAGSVTKFEIVTKETNKIPKKYVIYVTRSA